MSAPELTESAGKSILTGRDWLRFSKQMSKQIPKQIPKQMGLVASVMGLGVILLALASYYTDQRLSVLFEWMQQVFGWGYALTYSVLLVCALFAFFRLSATKSATNDSIYWFELGQQTAGGIATLSLTFTLLGISLGIGALSDKTIDPTTIQSIIQELTKHFSTAFMTTVVGLPTANFLRALISLKYVRLTLNDIDVSRNSFESGENP